MAEPQTFAHDLVHPKGTRVRVTGKQGQKDFQLLYGDLDGDMLESAVVLSAVYGFGRRKIFGAESLGNGAWRLTAPKSGAHLLDVTVAVVEK